ncbi:LuxR C-terminal-related transcriptional regulator [Bradyrhizobium sp. CB3481]|uniref:LuxR C-terminal-related transcriptional regulator n=1 Tax=Bradyrhizobium sp. CB3481 TaxID=3039158 RepID=UPI0024B1AE35|nr:LuxR C-terminal-related transcriptional regulator [Bradyrhizobium sp. CB3481]WFU17263.1 LuxR C-terminal-related transcriptional regulator [Bradyrhizobium sp. CB3481]
MLDVSADQGTFTRSIRLVIADRQPIVLQGLKSLFAAQRDFEIVASCNTGTSCVEAIRNLTPDVALLADTMLDLTISEILAVAKAERLATRLVFFTESEISDELAAAIAAGACSAISKYTNPDTMLRTLRLMTEEISAPPDRSRGLSSNGKGINGAQIEKMLGLLTHRESQIVRLVSEGLSNKEIARQLNVSQGTVKVHLHNIFQKLEISNRTVLATIALLQRSAGFSTLALAALAFAILDDVKASETNDAFPDDASTDDKDLEHPAFEVWKKAILRHTVVVDHGETGVAPQGAAAVKVSHNPAARREELHAAEHAVLSNTARGYGPVGSSTPFLFVSPLLQAINNSQIAGSTAPQPFPLPAFASDPVKGQAGNVAFAMTAAGALIYTLDHSSAAVQAPDPGGALIDASAVAAMDRTTQMAAIATHGAGDAGSNDVDSPAPGADIYAPHSPPAFGALGHESVTGEGNAGQLIRGGDNAISEGSGSDSVNGNDTITGGHGGDRLAGSNGNDAFVHHSAKDSNSAQLDTVIDFTSGADKINLAALGALAFLHLTSTSTSVPPHTLAWIYDPTTNETIVYVNPTDHSLDIGDSGLLEIHLQGVVSVAESDFVHEPDAAAVAAALQGIDPELLKAAASDGTVLTGSADTSVEAETSERALAAADIWTMPADDGFRFHIGRDRIGSAVSTRLTSFDDDLPYATEARDDDAVTVPAHVSSIQSAHSHTPDPIEEKFTFKNEPAHANSGTVTTGHGKANVASGPELFELGAAVVPPVPGPAPAEPGVAPGNSAGHGNSQHAAQSAAEPTEPGIASGNGIDHGNTEHAPNAAAAKASAAVDPPEPGVTPGHGNSQQASHPASAGNMGAAEPLEPGVAPGNSAGHGNSQHAEQSPAASSSAAAELPEPGATSGNGAGHGNEPHAPNSAAAKASAAVDPPEPGVTSAHGNSPQTPHSASASNMGAAEPVAPGNSEGHGNSQHAAPSAAADVSAAAAQPEPGATSGNSVGHGNAQHAPNSAAANASTAAEPTEPGISGHNNPEPASHPAAASAAAAAEPIEIGAAPGNGGDHGNPPQASQSVAANASAAAEPTEPGVTPAHSNSEPASHPAAASAMAAAEPIETGAAPGNGGGHGNPPQASQSVAANASAAAEPTEPGVISGHNNPEPPSDPVSASAAAEPIETGVASGNGGGHDNPPQPSQSAAASASAAAEPIAPVSGSGAPGQETAFHFNNEAAPSTPTASVELQELDGAPAPLSQAAELAAILEAGPAAPEEHAASHANNAPHHAAAHGSHDLLT